MKWDLFLGLEAQKFARSLANKIDLMHGTVGENLFVKMGSNGTTKWSCHSAAMAWLVKTCMIFLVKKKLHPKSIPLFPMSSFSNHI